MTMEEQKARTGNGQKRDTHASDTSIRLDRGVAEQLRAYRNRLQRSVDSAPGRYPFYLRHAISLGEAVSYLITKQLTEDARRRRIAARHASCHTEAPAPTAGSGRNQAPAKAPDERFAVVDRVDRGSLPESAAD